MATLSDHDEEFGQAQLSADPIFTSSHWNPDDHVYPNELTGWSGNAASIVSFSSDV